MNENEKIEQWIADHGGKPRWKEIAVFLGCPEKDGERLRSRYKYFRESRGDFVDQKEKYKATYQMNGDGIITSDRLIEMSEEESKSPSRVVELHGFDPDEWELIEITNNYWQMMKSHKAGGGTQILYQSKIRLKPRNPNDITLSDIDRVFANYTPPKMAKARKRAVLPGDLLEVNLGDLHIDGDGDIFERVKKIVEHIEMKAQFYKFSQSVLVFGGDIFHYDTVAQTTTGGTKLETSGMGYASMFDCGLEVANFVIQRLSSIAPIKVPFVPGNHDESYAYHLIKGLEGYYRNDENVTFDCGHDPWKGCEYGENLIVWQHGDIPKKRLKAIPQTEFREAWGRVQWVELHTFHLHHEEAYEDSGVIVRHLPAVAGQSTWERRNGFNGAKRGTICYVWDKEAKWLDTWAIRL